MPTHLGHGRPVTYALMQHVAALLQGRAFGAHAQQGVRD
jgi:hypothetical protein